MRAELEKEKDRFMERYDFETQPSILIQGAMESETQYMIGQLEEAECVTLGNYKYYTGFLGKYREPVIISRTYQGMVNAAAATILALTYFAPKAVINQGIAGGHAPEIHLGNILIGERIVPMGAVMWKFGAAGAGIDAQGFGPLELEIFNKVRGETEKIVDFPCDERLLAAAERVKSPYRTMRGVIGSADEWNNQLDRIALLRERYQTMAEEMESAAMAQLCVSYGTPFIGVRIISNSIVNGEEYDESVGTDIQKFVIAYVEELNGFACES